MAMNYLQYPPKDCISLLTNPILLKEHKKETWLILLDAKNYYRIILNFHLLFYTHKFSLL